MPGAEAVAGFRWWWPERTTGFHQSGLLPYQRGVYTQSPPSARGKTQVVEEPISTMVRMST